MEEYLLPYFDQVIEPDMDMGSEWWYLARLELQLAKIKLGNRLLVEEYFLKNAQHPRRK